MSIRHENMILALTKRVEELEQVVRELVARLEPSPVMETPPPAPRRNAHGRRKEAE